MEGGSKWRWRQLQEQNQLASQVPYIPRSNGPRLDTLTPRNMASAVQSALDDLEGRVGDVDEFVAQKLNYPSVEAMHGVLAAEQVDGVALSIDNIERGDGSLIGDQTGVGKGRQMAAMIRYAQETDRTPIFVTRDAGLYCRYGARPGRYRYPETSNRFITNSQEKVPLPDGRTLETKRNRHAAELDRLIQQGGFAATDDYDGVFTTYSQMQTVKGQETPRRQFLDMMAPQSLILFDEAHEAGGSPEPENSWKKAGPPNRADFARRWWIKPMASPSVPPRRLSAPMSWTSMGGDRGCGRQRAPLQISNPPWKLAAPPATGVHQHAGPGRLLQSSGTQL
jgi:hypothetical protein